MLPYHGMFRSKTARNLYCTFATLSVTLQVVAHKGKQYGTMHVIQYLKYFRNELP